MIFKLHGSGLISMLIEINGVSEINGKCSRQNERDNQTEIVRNVRKNRVKSSGTDNIEVTFDR